MKKIVLLFLLLFPSLCMAYDPLYESGLDTPTEIGTVAGIWNCTDTAGAHIGRWKSVRVQATASGTVTHFLIPLANTTGITTAPVGFAVYNGTSGESDAIGSLIARGYYASYSFGSGAGWYALPFTSPTTFSVTSGNYYHLVFLLDKENSYSNPVRGTNCAQPFIKWSSQCDAAACDYDMPPGVGTETWNFQFATDSGPWEMGLLITTQGLPNSISVTGSLTHGSDKIISGAEFGIKSPAAPLWWDDMEGATNGSTTFTTGELSWVKSGYWTGLNKHYSEARPATCEDDASRFHYRSVNYRSTSAPHSKSKIYATAAHYQNPAGNDPDGDSDDWYSNSPQLDVMLTIDSGVANKEIWFAHWYYRVDPSWTLVNSAANHKKSAVNYGTTGYDSDDYGSNCYVVSQNLRSEGGAVGDTLNYSNQNIFVHSDDPTTCGNNHYFETLTGANAKDSWVAIDQIWDNLGGVHEVWTFDGSVGGSGKKNWLDGDVSCRNSKNNTRSFTLGGYFVTNNNAGAEWEKQGHANNFRYFDDVYIDNTFSRVMLCNNQTFSSATVCEPQIPSAWAADSITVTVNQGALPNGTAYLFVFDSDNVANTTGVSVTIGGAILTPQSTAGSKINIGVFK